MVLQGRLRKHAPAAPFILVPDASAAAVPVALLFAGPLGVAPLPLLLDVATTVAGDGDGATVAGFAAAPSVSDAEAAGTAPVACAAAPDSSLVVVGREVTGAAYGTITTLMAALRSGVTLVVPAAPAAGDVWLAILERFAGATDAEWSLLLVVASAAPA